MVPRTEREIFETVDRRGSFDLDTVRRILERAAVEQYRLDAAREDSYSREDLEEMAAEAGISREALDRALQRPPPAQPRMSRAGVRRAWSRRLVWIGLAGLSALAFIAIMLAFPAVAEILFWTVIVLTVLVLLGAVPV